MMQVQDSVLQTFDIPCYNCWYHCKVRLRHQQVDYPGFLLRYRAYVYCGSSATAQHAPFAHTMPETHASLSRAQIYSIPACLQVTITSSLFNNNTAGQWGAAVVMGKRSKVGTAAAGMATVHYTQQKTLHQHLHKPCGEA